MISCSVDDANFVRKTADTAILRLTTYVDLVKTTLARTDMRPESIKEATFFLDRWFLTTMQKLVADTKVMYDKAMFREALKLGFFDLSRQWGVYLVGLGDLPPLRELALLYLEVQTLLLSPITPHTCEYVWKLLGKEGLIVDARYPEVCYWKYNGLLPSADY